MKPLKILVGHNRYQQRGGEDVVFETETAGLRHLGHDVRTFEVDNARIRTVYDRFAATVSIANSRAVVREFEQVIETFSPDIVHLHNIFPLLSPEAVRRSAARGLPTFVTLHNYRMVCANALLLRDGRPCEDCVGGSRLPALRYRCYRGSIVGSAAVAHMGLVFRDIVGTHPDRIRLIALTEFGKSRFVADGYAAESIVVKPNAVSDYGVPKEPRASEVIFVGRVSAEKGIDVLLEIARRLSFTVRVIGDGPELARLRAAAPANVVFHGALGHADAIAAIKRARALMLPSRCYETFPMVICEAYATGTPVIASRLGALAEIVEDGVTGRTVLPDDIGAWVEALTQLMDDDEGWSRISSAAREIWRAKYEARSSCERLVALYREALSRSRASAHNPTAF